MSKFESVGNLPRLHEVDGEKISSGKTPLIWDFELPPHIDQEKIVVNMAAVRRLHVVGAFTASIVRSYEGETTQFTPGITGINPDGSAIASKTGVTKKAKPHDSDLFDPLDIPPSLAQQYGKPFVFHKLNRPDAADQAVDAIREGTDQHVAWANALNKSLKTSYSEMGKKHLTGRADNFWKVFDGVVTLSLLAGIISGDSLDLGIYLGFKGINLGIQSSVLKRHYGNPLLDQRRHSLSYMGQFQPDRNLLLNTVLATSKVIKAKK